MSQLQLPYLMAWRKEVIKCELKIANSCSVFSDEWKIYLDSYPFMHINT